MMRYMNDLMTIAQEEFASITKELRELDMRRQVLEARAAKLQMFLRVSEDLGFMRVVDVRGQSGSDSLPMPPPLQLPPLPQIPSHRGRSEATTQKEKITEFCAELLKIGFPMKTSELLRELESANIEVGGANKLLTVSALLSKDGRFVPSRKEGWSLKD